MIKHSLVTLGCLVASLGFYSVGNSSAAACLLLGMAFEAAFWVRLLRRRRP
jgi:hypothetical protein